MTIKFNVILKTIFYILCSDNIILIWKFADVFIYSRKYELLAVDLIINRKIIKLIYFLFFKVKCYKKFCIPSS